MKSWRDTLDEVIEQSALTEIPAGKVHRVAMYYSNLCVGGISRVILKLSELIAAETGNSVVIITKKAGDAFFALPPCVRIVEIPEEPAAICARLPEVLREEAIDCVIFHEHWLPEIFFLANHVRLAKVRSAVIIHSSFFYPLYEGWVDLFYTRFKAFKHIDAVCCLTSSDCVLWKACGIERAAHIPNPLTFLPSETKVSCGDTQNVVFVGRISEEKGAAFLPEITRRIVDGDARAKVVILGDFETGRIRRRFRRDVERLGVGAYMEMRGFVRDVSEYLSDAAALIMPSRYEGHPMARIEAAAHGVPTVMFSLPYLEPYPPDSGCMMVGKEDPAGMAEAVLRLLRDSALWNEMSLRARAGLADLAPDKIAARWMSLFAAMGRNAVGEIPAEPGREYSEIIRMILDECAQITNVMQQQKNAFRYLKPVDKFFSLLFPPGSNRRVVFDERFNTPKKKFL